LGLLPKKYTCQDKFNEEEVRKVNTNKTKSANPTMSYYYKGKKKKSQGEICKSAQIRLYLTYY